MSQSATTNFHPGAFNLHTTSLTDTHHHQPLTALVERRVYGRSWFGVVGEALLGVAFMLAVLFLFFYT